MVLLSASFRFRVLAALLLLAIVLASPARAEVKALGVLPFNSNPTPTLFEGQDGFLYGVLRETNLPNPQVTNGAVYQISPAGGIRFLHLFPRQFTWPEPNIGGSIPENVLTMGKDGFLYGLTRGGGAHGFGVFYRLGTDRSFQVLGDIPHGLQLAYMAQSWMSGSDGALYVVTWDGVLRRLGLDGSVQPIYRPSIEGRIFYLEPANADHSEAKLRWVETYARPGIFGAGRTYGRKGIAHVVTLSLPSGEVLATEEFPFLTGLPDEADVSPDANEWGEASFISNRPGNRIFASGYYAALGRILSVNDSGEVSSLATYIGPDTLPHIPRPARILPSITGSLYFSAGQQTKGTFGLFGGTEIHVLTPGGPQPSEKLVDLKGYPLAAWCETRDGHLYGISWGPVAVGLGEDLPSARAESHFQPMKALRTVGAASSSSTASKPRGSFRRTNPQDPNLAPIARQDRFALPARASSTALRAPVLRNDRDPERGKLTLQSVGTPRHGTATIVPGSAGQPSRIDYVPTVWPRRSDVFSYTVADAEGKTSTGQVSVRANARSRFRGEQLGQSSGTDPVNLDVLALNVSPTGRFAGTVKLNGVTVPISGTLDYSDSARVSRRIRSTPDFLQAQLSIVNAGDQRQLEYTIQFRGETLTGSLLVL